MPPLLRVKRPRLRRLRAPLAILALLAGPLELSAQCPDGTPSPCSRAKPAVTGLGPRRIVVLPFENLAHDTALADVGRVTQELLIQGVAELDSVEAVPSLAIARALSGQGTQPTDLGMLTRRLGASTLVTGNVTKFRDSIRVQANIIDARSGRIIRAVGPVAGPAGDPFVAIAVTRERVLGSFMVGDMKHEMPGQPPKYSAYREWLDGWRVYSRDPVASRPYFERAISLDSTFALPYYHLAISHTNRGEWEQAERIVQALERLRDRLAPSDRASLDYLQDLLRGDFAGAVRDARFVESHGMTAAGFVIGFWSNAQLRPRDAIPAFVEADQIQVAMDYAPQVIAMAEAYHEAADHRSELARLDRGRREFPNSPAIVYARLRAFAGLGEPQHALALADTLLGAADDPTDMRPIDAVATGAMEFAAHGDEASGVQINRLLLEWFRTHPSRQPSAARERSEGQAWLAAGRLDSAALRFMNASTDTTSIANDGYLGLIAAQRGDTARAGAIADSLGRLSRKWDRGESTYWRAAVLAQLGERDEAVALLRQAEHAGQSMVSWHYALALHSLRGYPAFEALIQPAR